ncbi:hypothetical protein [Bradyrhizobium viridifuturi]|uniref:hypothetical protein n=1 Tax=Bradyrhizobium viridifuturi TaxID=1654716 RepID=UPI000AC031CA|nr:hypothetical protein [Bradyrhizobium viridifuturi]
MSVWRELPDLSDEVCKELAASLPTPLSAFQLATIFANYRNALFEEKPDPERWLFRFRNDWSAKEPLKFWTELAQSIQTLMLLLTRKRSDPEQLKWIGFHRDYISERPAHLSSLARLFEIAVKHVEFLESVAAGKKGGRLAAREAGYGLLVDLWISAGGEPSISTNGKCAQFLSSAAPLLMGEDPKFDSVKAIISRAVARRGQLNQTDGI